MDVHVQDLNLHLLQEDMGMSKVVHVDVHVHADEEPDDLELGLQEDVFHKAVDSMQLLLDLDLVLLLFLFLLLVLDDGASFLARDGTRLNDR